MRKIKEVLRLKWEQGLTNRTIAKSLSIARSTVGEYLRRAKNGVEMGSRLEMRHSPLLRWLGRVRPWHDRYGSSMGGPSTT
jgi:hypothetical protein